jgi:hypothetical protein
MNAVSIAIATAVLLVACGFAFQAIVISAYWKIAGNTKSSLFDVLDKEKRSRGLKQHANCFEGCMKRFAWNVDMASNCTSKCRQ